MAIKTLNAFNHPRRHVFYILALCGTHFFTFLGARDFWETESHYAEITRLMLSDGEYWITRLNGALWADSPPFYFWLAVLTSRVLGGVTEWTVRLPSALSATALVVAFYLFSRRWMGARVAFIATLLLSTSALTIHVERHIPLNSTYFLWLTIAMFLFMDVLVSETARPWHAYGGWFFLGLACLTKAPISVLLPAVLIVSYLLVTRRWEKASRLRPVSGLLLLLLVGSPCFLFVIWKTSGNWIDHFFAQHHIWRNMRHGLPWYYSVVYFPIGFLPWAFLLPPALLGLWHGRAGGGDTKLVFLMTWWLAVLILAQLFDGHHNHYLFFALLPASLVLAIFVDKLASGGESARVLAWTRVSLIVACVLLILCGLAAPLIVWQQLPDIKWHMVLFSVIALTGALWIIDALRQWNYLGVVARLVILLLIVDLQIQGFIFPVLNRLETRSLAETLKALAKPGDGVAVYQSRRRENFFNFYSGIDYIEHIRSQPQLMRYLSLPGSRFLLVEHDNIDKLRESTNGNLLLISNHQPAANGWFARSFPRWALMYSCAANCPPVPPAVQFPPSA